MNVAQENNTSLHTFLLFGRIDSDKTNNINVVDNVITLLPDIIFENNSRYQISAQITTTVFDSNEDTQLMRYDKITTLYIGKQLSYRLETMIVDDVIELYVNDSNIDIKVESDKLIITIRQNQQCDMQVFVNMSITQFNCTTQ